MGFLFGGDDDTALRVRPAVIYDADGRPQRRLFRDRYQKLPAGDDVPPRKPRAKQLLPDAEFCKWAYAALGVTEPRDDGGKPAVCEPLQRRRIRDMDMPPLPTRRIRSAAVVELQPKVKRTRVFLYPDDDDTVIAFPPSEDRKTLEERVTEAFRTASIRWSMQTQRPRE
jgi:hypothetical protein